MRGPSASAVGLLALVAGVAGARGDVVVGEGVPFTATELEDAIAARGEPAVEVEIEVERTADAGLRLITANGTWHIAVGEAHGPVAARLVALHVVDREELGTIALPPPRVSVAPTQTVPWADLEDEPTLDPAAAAITERAGPWLTFRTGTTRGTAGTDLTAFVGAIELGGERESWLAAIEAGIHASGSSPDAGDVSWVQPHARASLGRRVGAIELLGGVVLGRLFLTNVSDRPAATMVALGGSARLMVPLGRGAWTLVGGVGADAYHHRIVIRRIGVEEASTPRVALSATFGLSMVLGR